MRAFVTGATGFIGGRVVARLRGRGDEVVALVRSPANARELEQLGVELLAGDLDDLESIRRGLEGADACFHIAAVYKVGVPQAERQALIDANVGGTERVLDAAIDAGIMRIVYVSTCNVFGNTHGEVVDETYRRDEAEGFLSAYDESKYRAHLAAEERIARGAPIVVVMPAGVYGPNDHSELGNMIDQTRRGRMLMIPFPDTGIGYVHVDDVADGILLAYDKGRDGESYVLSGTLGTIRDLVEKTAQLSGRRKPRLAMPTPMMKLVAPLGPVVGPLLGYPPNMKELITVSDGVTMWARDDKARRELGFEPRPLDEGLRQTLAASR
jgi:dihydroflavonol-4-reductase